MKKGNVQSDQSGRFQAAERGSDANGMEIVDSGDLVRFTRGVVLDLDAGDCRRGEEAKR